ncbi:MAG: carboxypeptidase regulatory-like domain-containing protein [bacterium]|nr:carboxypeptidase regulatory-like domain-containing protein [bacterium]
MLLHCNSVEKLLLPLVLLLASIPAAAHGVRIQWAMQEDSISICAFFDDGQAMSEAQVTVFSGENPLEVYASGVTNEEGEFSFFPDIQQSLNWDVQVRKAGHGDMAHISLADNFVQRGFTTLQIILMSACVVWGFIGTSLFLATRKKEPNAHS